MPGQHQGSSSGRTEVTVRLDWTHINRHRLKKLSEQLLELAKLSQKHEMALIHWNLVPDTPEYLECKRLEKEMQTLALQIQSNYSKTPSFP